jgi:hypothetical protein
MFFCFGVDFLRFHKLLIDPCGHVLLDSAGRRHGPAHPQPQWWLTLCSCTALPRRSPLRPTLPDHTLSEQLPLHPTLSDQSAAGTARSSPLTARPVRRLSQPGAQVAYSHLRKIPAVVCSSKRLPLVSHDIVYHILTQRPPIASKFRKLDSEELVASKAEFKQLE